MDDIFRRLGRKTRRVGIDVTSDFFKDLLSNDLIVKHNIWPFLALDEMVLYDGTGIEVFKKGYKGDRVDFDFKVLEVEVGEKLARGRERVKKMFDDLDKQAKADVPERPYMDDIGRIINPGFDWVTGGRRPEVKVMQLVVT